MAVDLGGTNFRVCSIELHGDSTYTLTQAKTPIPKSLMIGTSKELFSFLAQQVKTFVDEHHADHFNEDADHHLRLGFTFSFPVDQKGINKGYLIRWTKGFDIKDAIGKDVCKLLQDELDLLEVPVIVAALVNDTVGTLMARSYTSPGKTGTLLGAIFGTGTNGAYVEKLSKITKMTASLDARKAYGEFDTSTGEMVINTEWGSFDNAMKVLPDTRYDRALDGNSFNPGIQMFEKRVSGMFLGEILRNAILVMKDEQGLFSSGEGQNVHIADEAGLFKPWSIDTSFLSIVESDEIPGLHATINLIASELGVHGATQDDAEAVRIIARAIGRRSARLSAIPIAAVVISTKFREEHKDDEGVDVTDSVAKGLSNLNLNQERPKRQRYGERRKSVVQIVFDAVVDTVTEAYDHLVGTIEAHAAPLVDTPPPAQDIPKPDTSGEQELAHTAMPVRTEPLNGATKKSEGKTVSGFEDQIIDIGVDGSVVEHYPGFERYLREALIEVKEVGRKGEKRIRIGAAKDGSGVGAALIALVASI